MEHERAARGWAWFAVLLAVVDLALCVAVPLLLSGGVLDRPRVNRQTHGSEVYGLVVPLVFALSGLALAWWRPRNAIGWLLLGVGTLQAVQMSFQAYGTRALTDPDQSLPFGLFSMWLASWTWIPALAIPIVLLPPLYPYGRPTNRFWRWHVCAAVLGLVLVVVVASISQGGVDDQVEGVRLPFDAPSWLTGAIGVTGAILLFACGIVSLAGTVVRLWRASKPERQQLAWLLTVAIVLAASVFLPVRGPLVVAYGLFPVAVAVGVLRYQLLGIEVAVRRTLLYGPLTVLVALTVGGVSAVVVRLAPDGPLPLLVASAVIAVVVFPVSALLRRLVDRLLLGDRRDPLTAVDRVGERLEELGEDPVASVVQAVAAVVRAPYVVVLDAADQPLAATGAAGGVGPEYRFSLRHAGRELGVLVVRGQLHPAERRVLDALAPHVAVVLAAHRLTLELEQERERVLAATNDERDRVRRELHDGLGASLSGIALVAEAGDALVSRDPEGARAILQRVREEAGNALLEVRRVVDALRPAALDRLELGEALEQAAEGLGLGRQDGPEFDLAVEPLPPLAPEVEVAAFRIATEALANVARHSGAAYCRLELARSNGHLVVRVSDNGSGYREPRRGGVGIPSMRRRAEQVGGRFTISGAPGSGTCVEVTLPMGTS